MIAENLDVASTSFTGTTDEKGRFGMIGLRSGLWKLKTQAPGFAAHAAVVTVRQLAFNAPVAFVLQRALGSVAAKDIQTALSHADKLFNTQRWDAAIVAYRTILANVPALSVINLQIAAAYRNKGEPNKAIEAYNDLLNVDPSNSKAKIGVAMTNLEKGDVTAAEVILEAAAQAPDATREVYYNLAEVKLLKNKLDEATNAYELATAADPAWGKPVLALGRVAMSKGDTGGALEYFNNVVDIDPASPEAGQARAALEQIDK